MARIRILVTSSHRPSQRIRSFIKDLAAVGVFFKRINRGKMTIDDLARLMHLEGIEYVFIVNSYKGNPGAIDIYGIDEYTQKLVKIVKLWIKGVRLSRESNAPQCLSSKIVVDPSKCFRDQCFKLADLLAKIISTSIDLGSVNSDRLIVMDRDKLIYIKFAKDTGNGCGPLIKISKVQFYR